MKKAVRTPHPCPFCPAVRVVHLSEEIEGDTQQVIEILSYRAQYKPIREFQTDDHEA